MYGIMDVTLVKLGFGHFIHNSVNVISECNKQSSIRWSCKCLSYKIFYNFSRLSVKDITETTMTLLSVLFFTNQRPKSDCEVNSIGLMLGP